MVSYVQFLLANFVSSYYRITTWPPQKKKKNQLLLVSSTFRPNLLCFGFDLTQSQSSKPISRNGYGPNCLLLFKCKLSCYWRFCFTAQELLSLFLCFYYFLNHLICSQVMLNLWEEVSRKTE